MSGVPGRAAVFDAPAVERLAAGFMHCLRSGGIVVAVGQTIRFAEALEVVGVTNGNDVYWAGRATLISRPEDLAMYDAMFLAFFHRSSAGFKVRFDHEPETAGIGTDEGHGEGDQGGDEVEVLRYSACETFGAKDFADFTKEELSEAQRVMSGMRLKPAQRRSRRRTPNHRGNRHDLRRTVQAAMRSAGEPIELRRTKTGERTRRLVLLLDVSGSMEPYSRVLIRFAHAAVVGRGSVEVFGLGTRLTRMTRQLRTHDVDEAVARAAEAVVDWSGGTRLGEAIGDFNDEWGVRGMARGAIVVVLSDGWDRGDPDEVASEMERLQRTAHKVIWVNPLKASPGYEPIAGGMAAAMPHIDTFLEGHCLDSLVTLAESIRA